MRRVLLFPIIFVLLLTPCAAQKVRSDNITSVQQLKFGESDKVEIILSVLNQKVLGEPNLQVSWQSDKAYISTENLPQSFVRQFQKIKGIKIEFVSPEKLEERARNNFDYMEFCEFEIEKNKVLISLCYSYLDSNTSSISYEFRKIKGKWKGKLKGWSATTSSS
jgi:hypothetical protein